MLVRSKRTLTSVVLLSMLCLKNLVKDEHPEIFVGQYPNGRRGKIL